MATIQDIFDWLNQGAQGDIPGTGGGEPNAPTASAQPQSPPPTPGSQADGTTMTPQDFADIPPALMGQYDQLIKNGIPRDVARTMLTSPSYAEGERMHESPQWTPPQQYAGGEAHLFNHGRAIDPTAPYEGDPTDYDQLWQALSNRRSWDAQNLPTPEEYGGMAYDTSGLVRLPSGQYVPAQQDQKGGQKKSGLQADPGYQAGMQGGTGILDMLFGKQPSQTIGDWLSGGWQ